MDRRTFLTAVAGTTGAMALGACTGQQAPQPPGQTGQPAARPTLRLPGGDSGFPSPFTYSRGGGYVQTSYIYDTLMWKDSTGRQIPWLAEGYERSDDGRTYTFRLREGVRWHDGQPFTANDVAFTYRYFAEQTISPQVIVQPIPPIEDVVAIDDRTVEFRLSAPAATFLGFGGAGAVPIVPEHIWSGVGQAAQVSDLAMAVGTGPYKLGAYSPGEGAYLYNANEDFFLGRPWVSRIENIPVGEELAAIRAGEIAQAGTSGARPEVLAPFRDNPDAYQVLEFPPGSSLDSLYWNCGLPGALSDVRFRQACARAINREELVQRLFGGNGATGNPGWIPPEHPYHVDVEQYPFDPAAANQMLDAAGYRRGPDGVRAGPEGPLEFTLLLSGEEPVVELLVGALQRIGVRLNPQVVDRATFNERVIAENVEMCMIGSGGMNSDLAPDYLRLIYATYTELTQDAIGYANPEVDRLCREQLRTLNDQRRMEVCAEIQRLVATDLPLLPLYYPGSASIVRRDSFQSWYVTPGGVAHVIPTLNNKHAFVTGRTTGLEVRTG